MQMTNSLETSDFIKSKILEIVSKLDEQGKEDDPYFFLIGAFYILLIDHKDDLLKTIVLLFDKKGY